MNQCISLVIGNDFCAEVVVLLLANYFVMFPLYATAINFQWKTVAAARVFKPIGNRL